MQNDNNATPIENTEDDTSGIHFAEDPLEGLAEVFAAEDEEEATEETEEATEETKEEPKEEEPKGPRASRSIALAAKKEKELRAKQEEFRQQYEQWEQEKQQYAQVQELLQNAHKDPIGYLQAAGLDLNTLADYVVNNSEQVAKQKPAELTELEKKIEQIEQQQRQKEEQEKQLLQQQQAQLLEQFETSVYNFIENNDFPAIKALEGQQYVIEIIQRHAAETGTIMNYPEACSQIESALMERIEQITKRPVDSVTKTHDVAKTPRTLSNDMVSDTGVKGSRELTDEEADLSMNQWIVENVG